MRHAAVRPQTRGRLRARIVEATTGALWLVAMLPAGGCVFWRFAAVWWWRQQLGLGSEVAKADDTAKGKDSEGMWNRIEV